MVTMICFTRILLQFKKILLYKHIDRGLDRILPNNRKKRSKTNSDFPKTMPSKVVLSNTVILEKEMGGGAY